MSATATTPKLTAAQARKLHDTEVAVLQLEAQVKLAKATRDELRERYRDRLQLSADPKEAEKGILTAIAGGVIVRVSPTVSADSFSLKRYTDLGHQVTAAMREAIAPGKPYDRWTVKAQAGPKKIGAVEPT